MLLKVQYQILQYHVNQTIWKKYKQNIARKRKENSTLEIANFNHTKFFHKH